MKKYYIRRAGQEKGPFTLEQIYQSSIEATDFIWTEGMPGWQQAQTMEEFKGMFPSRLRVVHAAFNEMEKKTEDVSRAKVKGYVYIIVGTVLIFGFILLAFVLIEVSNRANTKTSVADFLIATLVLLSILIGGVQFFTSGLKRLSNGKK